MKIALPLSSIRNTESENVCYGNKGLKHCYRFIINSSCEYIGRVFIIIFKVIILMPVDY